MKKGNFVLAFAVLLAGGVFAQETLAEDPAAPARQGKKLFSVGGGTYFISDFGGGADIGADETYKTPYYAGGWNLFFDATYAELKFGILSGAGTMTESLVGMDDILSEFTGVGFDIGLQGKYPIPLGASATVFPIAGITYRIMVDSKINGVGVPKASDLNTLWFQLGGGLDYAITDRVYLRGSLLYGIRLETQDEKIEIDAVKALDPDIDVKARLGHGLTINIALGFKAP
jgi:opacity protein-like surface antigen